jgi:hypothetical protein
VKGVGKEERREAVQVYQRNEGSRQGKEEKRRKERRKECKKKHERM